MSRWSEEAKAMFEQIEKELDDPIRTASVFQKVVLAVLALGALAGLICALVYR